MPYVYLYSPMSELYGHLTIVLFPFLQMRELKFGVLCDFPKVIKIISSRAEMPMSATREGLAFESRL